MRRIDLTEEQKIQVEALAATLTTDQVADYLGIARSTFYDIMNRDAELSGRYKAGKAKAIDKVASSLYQNAIDGSTAAQCFYLKTRAGWRETDRETDKQEPITVNIVNPYADKPDPTSV